MEIQPAAGVSRRKWPDPVRHIGISIVLVVCAMAACAFLAKFGLIPWTTLIFVGGTVGGVVNSFRRIQKLPAAKLEEATRMTEQMLIIQIYVSPFVGGVFAMALYTVFMSGFVQGSLFPAFSSGDAPFTTFGDFAALSAPATNTDLAKAIVWSFIAGFSEGLVPNFISKIANEAVPREKSES